MKVSPPSKSDRSIPSFVVIRCALILFVGMIMPVSLSSSKAQGATLEDYRSRIHQSVATLDAVNTMDEDESDEAYKARIDDTLRTVKGLIPSNETVKAGESEMPVDNVWLGKSIAALNAEKTIEGRQAVLDYMTQRLSAIELQLGGSASDSTNNEENKARMAALLRRSEFAEKTEKESTLARIIRRANEW